MHLMWAFEKKEARLSRQRANDYDAILIKFCVFLLSAYTCTKGFLSSQRLCKIIKALL